jgi:hypothetical protein
MRRVPPRFGHFETADSAPLSALDFREAHRPDHDKNEKAGFAAGLSFQFSQEKTYFFGAIASFAAFAR